MRTTRFFALLCATALLAASPLYAQEVDPVKDALDLFRTMEKDTDMKLAGPAKKPFTVSWGGWITPVVIDERKGTELTSAVVTAKLWLQSTLWKNAFVYVRGKDVYLAPLMQSGIDIESDNVIDLDVGYIGMTSPDGSLQFYAGRKFFVLGTGLVFNGRGDGGEIKLYTRFVDLKLFGLYTGLMNKDTNPYGLSSRDISDGAKRIFAGGSISRGLGKHEVYLLGMAQIDQGDQESTDKTRYQSQYYAGGLKGLIIDGMDYYAEFIYETGKSYLSGSDDEKNISAMAGMLGINYYIDAPYNPAVLFQYAYGSGDKDRSDPKSPNGNTSGDDNGFLYFGTFVGGFALRPVLANLHVFRLGFSGSPFYRSDKTYLRRMSLIAMYNYYMKDKPEGTINNGEASVNSRDVGHGIDLSLRWGIFHDFSVFVNYGLFLPGSAFGSGAENRNFIMAGFNLVF